MQKRSDRFIYADPEDDGQDLRSRTDERRERRAIENTLLSLAKDLVAMSRKRLDRLELPEGVLDAVNDARAIRSAAALNRQLRVVRAALRDADYEAIQLRVRASAAGS